METMPRLTSTQSQLLRAAARAKSLTGLRQRGWIHHGADGYPVAAAPAATGPA